jgi:hypothetical protein
MIVRKAEIGLEYQPYIDYAPVTANDLHAEACKADDTTVKVWRPKWEKNIKTNHDKHGPFAEKSLGKLYGYAHHKPVIVVGSGPSIKNNAHELKNKKDITVLSCLHNFHFMEDNNIPVDFYVSLDAGEVVIEEVYEGGSKSEDEYWSMTKNRKLLCYIGTHPKLLEKWQGEVYFFNCPVPDQAFMDFVDNVELFNTYVSTGGNVLGSCLYIAKAYFGASIVGFLGADFCFSYNEKFHAWDSKYDASLGHYMRVRDVFGLPVKTWKSYHNFKGWFEFISMTVPGVYYNCSEGGTFGAYDQGNIRSVIQFPLKDFIRQMNMYEEIEEQAKNPKVNMKKLLF